MNQLFIIFACIFVACFTLKISEIGRNDWHLEHIGELSDAHIIQNKLFFLTKENIFGHLKLQNGKIDSRIVLSPNDRLLFSNERQVELLTESNQIVNYKTHNLQRNINNRFINDKNLKSIHSYVKSVDGKGFFINDEKNIRFYPVESNSGSSSFKEVYTAKPNEIIQKIFYVENKLYTIILTDALFGFREIIAGKVEEYETILGFFDEENKQGWSINEAWHKQGSIVLVLYHKASSKYNTLVLTTKFQNNFQISSNYHQLIKNQLKFCSTIYDLKQKQQIKRLSLYEDLNLNTNYQLEDGEQSITIYNKNIKFGQIKKEISSLKSKHVFLLQKSATSFVFLVQYRDMTISAHVLQKGIQKQLWKRQEGLAFIDKVLFMKYPFSDHLDNQYHRKLQSSTYKELKFIQKFIQVPLDVALRVKEEISDLIGFISNSLSSLLDINSLTQIDLKSISKFKMSNEMEIKLGLKKYIIAVSKMGSIFSVDTKTNRIIWKMYRDMKNKSVVALIDFRKDYELEAAVLITYNQIDKYVILEEIKEDGTLLLLDRISCPLLPSIHKLNHQSIIIKYGDQIARYSLGSSHTHEKHFYFYTEEQSRIVGWKQIDNSAVQIWTFNLGQGQKIIETASAFTEQQHSHVPLFDNGKVIFKNIDFTNLAILTSKNATSMNLYILNGMTGQVHFNEYRSGLNLNHPVNLAYDQNNVIVTYYNNRNKLYEIWTVEQYQQNIQSSAIKMIMNYWNNLKYKPSRNRENIIFLSEVYGSPVSIKKAFISQSKQSIIRRNLYIITRDDKVYMIGRELVSTRRPKQTALFSNQAYPPYQYLLPYDPTKFFSYNLNLINLREIQFSSTSIESTIFFLAYGIDLYLIRIAPDLAFDLITEDFNYLILIAIMIAVTVGVLVLRSKAKNAKLIKSHRD